MRISKKKSVKSMKSGNGPDKYKRFTLIGKEWAGG